ncbi:hypothetical protein VTN00DRAFT_5070 [Thermoascus crustaceus]|uniref:uncharacterized protein n=1 Tax=Thermoascus crustaceus TaxID=5088 RepID=UPI003742E0F4
MANSTSGKDAGNHPITANIGGTSAIPTPANNIGGGTGWGDKGFTKGGGSGSGGESIGSEGMGHTPMPNPAASMGSFLGLSEQKAAAGGHYKSKFEAAAGYEKPTTETGEPTCEAEDHSFAEHKPGCPETLTGYFKVKNIWGK